jgi:hypothetical protein
MTFKSVKDKVAQFDDVTTKSMFGYECYSIKGKFFVGFSKKNENRVIVRLPKKEQRGASKTNGVKPFSHGVKAGWIEIDTSRSTLQNSMKWIKVGFENAKKLTKIKKK